MPVVELPARFGLVVRRARISVGLSQEGLAAAAGLDRTYISSLERGKRNPTLITQERIAAALRRPLSVLVAEAEGLS
ncbi:helix-turn-helix domain-containing protein [Rhodococcus qingshengii]|uniref:helix-turn-helix domain-containing protein n=1 Tax=Rhodococcus qingshengii TaxID=334542 RepID=UPI0027E10B70|nr:helix-turn-helix transcriptional regulator [Rhodococcus qingshengii]